MPSSRRRFVAPAVAHLSAITRLRLRALALLLPRLISDIFRVSQSFRRRLQMKSRIAPSPLLLVAITPRVTTHAPGLERYAASPRRKFSRYMPSSYGVTALVAAGGETHIVIRPA